MGVKTLASRNKEGKYEGAKVHLLDKLAVWKGKAHTLLMDCLVVSNDRDLSYQGTHPLKNIH